MLMNIQEITQRETQEERLGMQDIALLVTASLNTGFNLEDGPGRTIRNSYFDI